MFVVKVTGTTRSCGDCPFRVYYSGGIHECTRAGAHLPPGKEHEIPDWCPLGDYPATAMQRLSNEVDALRALLTEERGKSAAALRGE